jgi:hypothetical protein
VQLRFSGERLWGFVMWGKVVGVCDAWCACTNRLGAV